MTAPVGNTASARNAAHVFLDDDFEERLNAQVNQIAEKPLSQVGDFFKAKASNSIDTCNSLNDQSKEASKQVSDASIDGCIKLTSKAAIKNTISHFRNKSSQN